MCLSQYRTSQSKIQLNRVIDSIDSISDTMCNYLQGRFADGNFTRWVLSMLQVEPTKRPTIAHVLHSEFCQQWRHQVLDRFPMYRPANNCEKQLWQHEQTFQWQPHHHHQHQHQLHSSKRSSKKRPNDSVEDSTSTSSSSGSSETSAMPWIHIRPGNVFRLGVAIDAIVIPHLMDLSAESGLAKELADLDTTLLPNLSTSISASSSATASSSSNSSMSSSASRSSIVTPGGDDDHLVQPLFRVIVTQSQRDDSPLGSTRILNIVVPPSAAMSRAHLASCITRCLDQCVRTPPPDLCTRLIVIGSYVVGVLSIGTSQYPLGSIPITGNQSNDRLSNSSRRGLPPYNHRVDQELALARAVHPSRVPQPDTRARVVGRERHVAARSRAAIGLLGSTGALVLLLSVIELDGQDRRAARELATNVARGLDLVVHRIAFVVIIVVLWCHNEHDRHQHVHVVLVIILSDIVVFLLARVLEQHLGIGSRARRAGAPGRYRASQQQHEHRRVPARSASHGARSPCLPRAAEPSQIQATAERSATLVQGAIRALLAARRDTHLLPAIAARRTMCALLYAPPLRVAARAQRPPQPRAAAVRHLLLARRGMGHRHGESRSGSTTRVRTLGAAGILDHAIGRRPSTNAERHCDSACRVTKAARKVRQRTRPRGTWKLESYCHCK